MYWANFLHIYQPPTQTEDIVRRVADDSYRKIVSVLESAPQAKLTLNVSACLTDQLYRCGLSDIIDGIGRLAERGQVEFTGSAMFHPILPLISSDEVRRQIELNQINNRRYFGDIYNPRGFFPPEMCYSFNVADIAATFGYRWILVDEIGFDGRIGQTRKDCLYGLYGLRDFNVFFSDRAMSAGLTYGAFSSASEFLRGLHDWTGRDSYLLTATDGEIYGHHLQGQEDLLRELYKAGHPETVTVSQLLDLFPSTEDVAPLPSSWSTWEDEMSMGIPYPQWRFPGNDIHDSQWGLTYLANELLELVPAESAGYAEARGVLDQALHSCQYWWASCRPWWNPDMIERGANLLLRVVTLIEPYVPSEKATLVRQLAEDIVGLAQQWQASGKASRLRKQYLAEHQQVTSLLSFG